MHKDNREDIQNVISNYSYIGLLSNKLRVGIIGAGKGGTIKIKHFVNNKCYVEVLSQNFNEEIIKISKKFPERVKLVKEEFTNNFLKDKHLIVIAVDDEKLRVMIRKYCDDNYKIYIDCSNFLDGMGVVPVERSTENISFALNTKGGNPKGAILVSNKIKEMLLEYDEFISFTTKIRNRVKKVPTYKNEVLQFIGTENFITSFNEGNFKKDLESKFPKEVVEYLLNEK